MPKIKRRSHVFRIGGFGGSQTINISVPCSDAKGEVRMTRTKAAVLRGKPGIAVTCANAQCAMDSEGVFPHPCYLAEFTRSKAYIVDRLNARGQPSHCVRYRHDDAAWIDKFDKPGGKNKLLKSGEVERTIRLYPPAHRGSQAGSRPSRRDGSRTNKPLPGGAARRAINAGWIVAQTS